MTRSNPTPPAQSGSWLAIVGGFGVAAVLIQLPIFDRSFLLLDEGYVLAVASAIGRGQVAYRDVNIDAPFPGAFYLLAGWQKLVGPSIHGSRLLAIAIFALFVMATLWLARTFVSRATACLLGVLLLCYRIWAFPLWHCYGYQAPALALVMLSIATIASAVRRGSLTRLWVAGVFVAAAVFCKQDYGIAVGGLAMLVLLIVGASPFPGAKTRRWLPAVAFGGGMLTVVGPALAALAAAGALPGMWEQSVRVPWAGAAATSYPDLPPLAAPFRQNAGFRAAPGHYFPAIELTVRWDQVLRSYVYTQTGLWDTAVVFLFYVPVVGWPLATLLIGLPAAIRLLRGRPRAADAGHLLLIAFGMAMLLAFPRPRDWSHLMMIIGPTLVGAALLLDAMRRRVRRSGARLLDAVVVVALAALAWLSVGLGDDLRAKSQWWLSDPRARIYVGAAEGPLVETLVTYLRGAVPAGVPVPVYPTYPMIAFLADRVPPAGFYIVWPFQAAGRDEKIITAMERDHVPLVLYGFSQFAHLGGFARYAPRLFEYLATHFTIERVFSPEMWGPYFGALRRTEARPGTSLLPQLEPAGGLTAALWPFTPVLTAATGTPSAPRAGWIDLSVPSAGTPVLHFGFSTHPDRWQDFSLGPVTFTVRAGPEARELLFERTIDPSHRLENRQWFAGRVDLRSYAGGMVRLWFATETATVPARPTEVAAWSDPRLVIEP